MSSTSVAPRNFFQKILLEKWRLIKCHIGCWSCGICCCCCSGCCRCGRIFRIFYNSKNLRMNKLVIIIKKFDMIEIGSFFDSSDTCIGMIIPTRRIWHKLLQAIIIHRDIFYRIFWNHSLHLDI